MSSLARAFILTLFFAVSPTSSQGVEPAGAASTPAADDVAANKLSVEKLEAEIQKLQAEVASLESLGPRTRQWTAWLAAGGTVVGAVVGALVSVVVMQMGQRFTAAQEARRALDETLTRRKLGQEELKLIQDRGFGHVQHNLGLFKDLGHESHRARLAAAATLLDRIRGQEERLARLKKYLGGISEQADAALIQMVEEEERDAPLIKKVLLAVLKREQAEPPAKTDDGASAGAQPSRYSPKAISEAALRKYIADELVESLGAKYTRAERPVEIERPSVWDGLDFQNCDLHDVFWRGVDARCVDFFSSNLAKASLREAALQGAIFYQCNMVEAVLRDADLRGANLFAADLTGAELQGADLSGSILQGAILQGAKLDRACLDDAVYNTEPIPGRCDPTIWPDGFDPSGLRVQNS